MLVTSRIPYRFWQDTWVIVGGLGLSVVLLVLVIIPGVGVYLNGSRRWLSLGGISFQPSEIAKMAVVMYMAATLTYRGRGIRFLFRGILPVLVVPGFMFLLILEQPNLSTAGSHPHRQPDDDPHGGARDGSTCRYWAWRVCAWVPFMPGARPTAGSGCYPSQIPLRR